MTENYQSNNSKYEEFVESIKFNYYVDYIGKDVSFDRWRVNIYFQPNLAETHFFYTEQEYNDFILAHSDGFTSYTAFVEYFYS